MEEIEGLEKLIREARQSVKGLILSAHEKDSRMARYLIAHGVEFSVRCRETDYCDGSVRRGTDGNRT